MATTTPRMMSPLVMGSVSFKDAAACVPWQVVLRSVDGQPVDVCDDALDLAYVGTEALVCFGFRERPFVGDRFEDRVEGRSVESEVSHCGRDGVAPRRGSLLARDDQSKAKELS